MRNGNCSFALYFYSSMAMENAKRKTTIFFDYLMEIGDKFNKLMEVEINISANSFVTKEMKKLKVN